MPDTADPSKVLPLLVISCCVTTTIFFVACTFAVLVARARRASVAREHPGKLGGLWSGLAPAWYAGSLLFGMGGLAAGFYLLRRPRTARQGYVCVALGVVHVMAVVVGTSVGLCLFVKRQGRALW